MLALAFASLVGLSINGHAQIGNQVTEIVTDYGGYWRSGVGNINPVLPNNTHHLLAFTYDSVRYSTGVNDALLTSNGLTFTARTFNAIAVSAVPGTLTTNTKMGLGALYDGVNNGPSNPAPSAALSYYLMDGLQGLNYGTGVANFPVGVLRFDVTNLQAGSVGNGIPDILITQFANPASTEDKYSFRNAANQIVGNEVSINLSALNVLGNWTADFYETTPSRTLQAGFTQTNRALRLWAADLSVFGLNAGNIGTVTNFQIQLSGESDVAFVAYSTSALGLAPDELPGGVSKQPSLWLKANNGPNTMTNNVPVGDWADKSGKANNASQANAALRPVFRTQGSNFNPTVNFGAQYLNTFQNLTVGDGLAYTTFVVMQNLSTTTAKTILGSTGSASSVRQSVTAGNLVNVLHGATNVFPTSPPGYTAATRIWTTLYTGAPGNRVALDMRTLQSNTTAATFVNRPTQIGSHQAAAATGNANISEVITYPMALTDNEIQRVNTYLAVKYGITLGVDYLGCNSNVLFESDGAGTVQLFDNRITGIGRENCQLLNQKQSKSIHAGALVTLGGGNTIATDNTGNTTLLTDGSYLIAGDNNTATAWGTGTVAGYIQSRMARTWRVRKTGSVGSVLVRVPAYSSTEATKLDSLPANAAVFMLVNTVNNFTSGYTTVPMTLNGTNYETPYDFTNATFFTFGYVILNPLPVELVTFDAQAVEATQSVRLTWSTATEINNAYFTIEKSKDAAHWSLLGQLPGSNQSNAVQTYEMNDHRPLEGVSYYRLSQTDFDGTVSVEGVRSVIFNHKIDVLIYPNPAADVLNVKGKNIAVLELYDASGKAVSAEATAYDGLWTLPTATLPRGVYYLKITTTDGKTQTEKVVLE